MKNFLLLLFLTLTSHFVWAQSPCTGNVAIENLANGMDYTITVGAGGDVEVTLTVVDNPAGLVGFLGGPGGIFQIAGPGGTFTYNLTGQADPFVLDMFFNWAAGGAGNSETVSCSSVAPTICTGNVPIENLANGMDYTITVGAGGDVEVTLTVVDNPAGLVGFLGGPGGIFQIAGPGGTFTYNLTGQADPFVLDMFFNWAAGGAGNSETVSCSSAGPEICMGNVPIENLANGMDYTITVEANGDVEVTLTVVDNPAGLVGFLGGPGGIFQIAGPGGTFTYNLTGQADPFVLDMFFNWAAGGAGNSESVSCPEPPADTEVIFCVDMSCFPDPPLNPSVFGNFTTPPFDINQNLLSDPDGDGIYCATVTIAPGTYEYLFFDGNQGAENFDPGAPCTISSFGFTNRVLVVGATSPQMENFGWESCGTDCVTPPIPPDIPITFEDTAIDYDLIDFAGAVSTIAPDPTDPANTVLCVLKTNGAATFAGTIVGGNGLANPIPFTADNLVMTMRVWSPAAGTPILLKVENSGNPGISSEVLAVTTVAMAWETLSFDFSMGVPNPVNLALVYDKVVVFANFGNVGTNMTYYFDDIMMCDQSLVPVITCPANITIECDQDTSPANTGTATATDLCDDPTVTFSDVSTQAMGCGEFSYTIIRTWTATDAQGNAATCSQIITVEDNNPPTITCPANVTVQCDQPTTPATTGTATATGDNCATDAQLTITFTDVTTQTPGGCTNDSYTITRTWTATDPCGNAVTCDQIITVEDTTPPTIVCPADVTIECDESTAPANTGTAVAIDACAPAADITITFADVSTQAAAGCGNDTYTITRTWTATDPCGNATNCVQVISVEDTTPPAIVCPANVSLSCTANTDPASTGIATGSDNCSTVAEVVITSSDITTEGAEGCSQFTYTILRTWLATDACGNTTTCVQTIAVADTEPPVISCPPGQTLTCFETVPAPATNAADFIALGGTISDNCTTELTDFTVFTQNDDNGGDNCPGNSRTVVRTYFVSDACGNISTCTQTFTYLASTQGPVITSVLPTCFKYCADLANPMEEDITFTTDCSFGATVNIAGPQQIGATNCPGTIYRFTYTVTDDCGRTSAPVTRDFIIGNDGPTIQCPPFNLILECGDANNADYIAAHIGTVTANTSCDLGVTITHFPSNFNNITCNTATVVTFVATDACGRTASCTTTIDIMDSTAPEITSTYVDGVCNEAICGSNVSFWFNAWKAKVLEGLSATDACDSNVTFTTVGPNSAAQNCPDGTAETVITWVANDNCGNTSGISYSFFVVPANDPAPQPSIMGMIATEETETVEGVTVTLTGNNTTTNVSVTATDGLYGFENLEEGQNYSVTPALDENPLNGVTSFDLVLISKHILQIEALDSPYKMIAADINKSGSITTMDLVDLRKLILHIDENFANNTSWRFVEADYVFPQPNNPFASLFPEETFINGLTADEQHDFVAVKVGDVNGSAVANALAAAADRTVVGDLVFTTNDRQLKAGESYTVSFNADNFNAIHGYQFTLNFDQSALEFNDLKAGHLTSMSDNNFGLALLEKGVITTSWTNQEAQSLTRDARVFDVTFTAKADILLSEAISISSRFTAAEAYNANLDLMDVTLRFDESKIVTSELQLYQNTPNPFKQETLIGFELPEAGSATLNIYDGSGKLLKQVEGNYAKGYNSISLSNDGLSPGLLHYQLVSEAGTITKKMLFSGK